MGEVDGGSGVVLQQVDDTLQVGFGDEFVHLHISGSGHSGDLLQGIRRAGLQHEQIQGESEQPGTIQLQILAELFQVVQHTAV